MIKSRVLWVVSLLAAGLLFFMAPVSLYSQEGQAAAGAEGFPVPIQGTKIAGDLTPGQMQEAIRLQEKAAEGSLTPADIEAGRALLEQKRQERGKAPGAEIETEPSSPSEPGAKPVSEKSDEDEGVKDFSEEEEDFFFKKAGVSEAPRLEIYGHKLFSRDPATFAPITAQPVSDDYLVGPGDEIKVLMWGLLSAEYSLVVDNEGIINFPKLGPLTVAGLTFGELKSLIRQKAEAITGVSVSVTMGRLRTIQVFVLGEVKSPGVYAVSALATGGNALLYSGGPTRLGSLRNVQLKRRGKIVAVIDLYDFMLKGDVTSDVRLMPGDVIFVPQTGPLVSVFGNVNRPAVYELKDQKDLQTALQMAGGLAPQAFNQRIQIIRSFENQARIVLDIPYVEIKDKQPVSLQDGDLVRVFSILPSAVNAVYLYGNVLRPGQYAFREGLRVLDLVPDKKSLALDAYFDYALVKRYHIEEMQAELIPFDLGRLLELHDDHQNISLKPLDEIYIFNKSLFKDREFARAEGQVRRPGRYLIDQMKIRDLLLKAGSLTEDAYLPKAELIRIDKERHLQTIYFDVAAALADDPAHNLDLQHEDRVIIHSIWETRWKAAARIEGEIKQAGEFPITIDMCIKDLIFKAGGFTRDAWMEKGHLYRTDWQTKEVTILSFDVAAAMAGDPVHNIRLEDLDRVFINSIWDYKNRYTVAVNGQVNRPGEYPYASNMTVRDLILVAGNFKDAAYLEKGELTRFTIEDGREVQTSILNFNIERALENDPNHNIRLQPMDIVTVKTIPNWWEKKKTVAISGEVTFPGTYPIRENERISDVLERAGGFSEKAYLLGAVFTRESVRKVQQQRLEDLISQMESDVERLSSAEAQATLSQEDIAAQAHFVRAQRALIAKLRSSRASGRVVVSIKLPGVLKGTSADIVLEDGDTLYIPPKADTVNVIGSVYNPTALIFDPKEPDVKRYLELTGGPTRDAEEKSMYVVRVNGTVVSKRSMGWFGSFENIALNPGDTILVPEKIIRPSYMRDIKDITQILYQIAVAAGVTIALF